MLSLLEKLRAGMLTESEVEALDEWDWAGVIEDHCEEFETFGVTAQTLLTYTVTSFPAELAGRKAGLAVLLADGWEPPAGLAGCLA